jgi:hypothetical protein
MINHKSGNASSSSGGGVMSPPTAVTTPEHSLPVRSKPPSTVCSSSGRDYQQQQQQTTSPYVTLKRFTSASSDVLDEYKAKDREGDYEQREELIDRIKPMKKSSPLSKNQNQFRYQDNSCGEIESFEDNPRHLATPARENTRLDFTSSSSAKANCKASPVKVSPSKGLQNINVLVGSILTKSETISSDESEIMIHEPQQQSQSEPQPPVSPVISIRKTVNPINAMVIPKIVKMSSLSPQTIQLLQKCVERGYMTIQCKDDFHPYDAHLNQQQQGQSQQQPNWNSELLITLVESQKTRQGVALCKRTLTYLKVSTIFHDLSS